MDINQLRSFLEVCKTRHFGRAGENLFVTQAAISSRIQQLEEELGVRLFTRDRNNIQLTPEGRRFTPHAENLLATWNRACQEVELPEKLTEQLAIAATPGLCHYLLQQRVTRIREKLPLLSLRLESQPAAELAHQVLEGMHDVVLLYEPPNMPELNAVPLGKMRLALLASYEAENPQQAFSQNYVYVDWGSAFEAFHRRKLGGFPAAALYTNLGSFAEYYLNENPAAAYLPQQLASKAGLLKVPRAPAFARNVYAVYRNTTEKEVAITSVLAFLRP